MLSDQKKVYSISIVPIVLSAKYVTKYSRASHNAALNSADLSIALMSPKNPESSCTIGLNDVVSIFFLSGYNTINSTILLATHTE